MTSKQLEWRMRAAVIGWLRYERQCHLVCWERSPFPDHRYRPDIIAVTRKWKVIEVELKQTLGDFKANESKRGVKMRLFFPQQFYFCVPPPLVEAVKPLLMDGAGLLTVEDNRFGPSIVSVVGATNHKAATLISKFAVARMVAHQSASLHRACVALSRMDESNPPKPDQAWHIA